MIKNIEVTSKYVLPSTGYFEITKHKKGETSIYRLLDKMTLAMTQDRLAEFYESEKQKRNPLPLNSPQTFELLDDAVNSGNNDLMNHLHKILRNCWVSTTSRAVYNPVEQDKAIHNYGTSDAYTITGNIVGGNGFIDSIDDPDALELLLETKDVKEINKVSNAINQTPMYFWRLNSKPPQKVERVVWFYANVGRLLLFVDRVLSDGYPAFLVEKIK